MTQTARIGVIGAGWWAADTHIPALHQHPAAELVALCDTNPQRLAAVADKYGVTATYADHRAMLAAETLDGVIVVSSNATHYQAAKDCLEHGVHVMVEKPMTLLAPESRELVELARRADRELIAGYPFNYTNFAVRARTVIESGELGPVQAIDLVYNSYMTPLFTGRNRGNYAVHAPDQYTKPDLLGGGHGQVQVTHAAGLLFSVTGLRPQRVFSLMHNHGLAVDVIDVMMVEFAEGALGTVSGSGNYQGLTFRLQVNCAGGWIDIDGRAGRAVIHRNDTSEDEVILYDESTEAFPRSYATAHNLVDVITGEAANGSPGEVGWRAVELLHAAYESASQDGQPVQVATLY